jgi:hypothetical protein
LGIRCADHPTSLYSQKLALTSPTSCGRSVGIFRSRTQATEFMCTGEAASSFRPVGSSYAATAEIRFCYALLIRSLSVHARLNMASDILLPQRGRHIQCQPSLSAGNAGHFRPNRTPFIITFPLYAMSVFAIGTGCHETDEPTDKLHSGYLRDGLPNRVNSGRGGSSKEARDCLHTPCQEPPVVSIRHAPAGNQTAVRLSRSLVCVRLC